MISLPRIVIPSRVEGPTFSLIGEKTAATWWVISAKKEDTRLKRLETLIQRSTNGRTLPQLTRQPKTHAESHFARVIHTSTHISPELHHSCALRAVASKTYTGQVGEVPTLVRFEFRCRAAFWINFRAL